MARLDEVNLDEFDFDSPDEPVNTGGRRNMTKKLVIAFGRLSLDGFCARLEAIVTGMKDNPLLAEPWWDDPAEKPTVASLTADMGTFMQLKSQAENGDKQKMIARDALRENITADLKKLARYIELEADGDEGILESSGYELTKERTALGNAPLPAPQDLRLKKGELPGALIARCKSVKGAASYEAYICTGDTGVEANWHYAVTTSGCLRILLENLTPGTLYHIRVRAINRNGPGSWSDSASLRAD